MLCLKTLVECHVAVPDDEVVDAVGSHEPAELLPTDGSEDEDV